MAENFPGIGALLFALAMAPATLFALRSRSFVRSLDDPALPERLLSEQQRAGHIMGVVLVLLGIASPRALWWTVPLMVATRIAAGYPLRKALFDETWSLAEYLWFVARITAGIWGFWIVLALLPFAARAAGGFDWLAAGSLGLLLVAWNAWYGAIVRRLLRARPLEDPALRGRFEALAQTCRLPPPNFEQVDLGGGVIANAIALPGLRGSSVVFTDALLQRLEPDEAAAICAHELAHLEYYNPVLLRRLNATTYGLIALGLVLAVLPRFADVSSLTIAIVWAAGFLTLLMWRAHDRQRQETVCDQRAVALCGDVETVARALTKIHASARLPRRFDGELERHATHPSLARRLRDIRAAAGAAPASLTDITTFLSVDEKTELTFAEDRLHWREGTHATHSLSYDYLSELRLHAKVKGRPALVAVEKGGRRWETPVNDADVGRIQSILDVVDTRLANPAAGTGPWLQISKAVLACAAIFALLLGQLAAAIAALVAVFQSSTPILAGAGAAVLAGAGLSFRASETSVIETALPVALLLAALGVALLWAARANANQELPRRAWLALGMLAVCAAASTAAWLMNGIDPVDLHQSAVALPSTPVFLLALTGALVCWPSRWLRRASALTAVVAVLSAATGSAVFLDTFGRDPFLGAAAPVAWKTIGDSPQQEFTIPFHASAVRLSPTGRSVLVMATSDANEYRPAWHLGRFGRSLSRIEGTDIVFVDDDRVIVADGDEEDVTVREVHVDAPDHAIWEQQVSGITDPVLSFRTASRSWQLLGVDSAGAVVRATGTAGDGPVETMRWAAASDSKGWPQVLTASGGNALIMEVQYPVFADTRLWMLFSMLQGLRAESRVSRVDESGHTELARTRLMTHCHRTPSDDRLVCNVFDGTRTRFAAIDPATSDITPLAWLSGRFAGQWISQDGWMSGWLESEAVAIHATTHEGIRAPLASRGHITQVVATGALVGTVTYGERGSTLRLYRTGTALLRAAGSN